MAKYATKKQANCAHPARHVHPTIDQRYEACALCGYVRPANIPAPWMTAYDEAHPAPAPLLFGMTEEQITALMAPFNRTDD